MARDPEVLSFEHLDWLHSVEASVLNTMRNREVEFIDTRDDDGHTIGVVHYMLEFSQPTEGRLMEKVVEKLNTDQEDAAIAEQKQNFVDKRDQQIGFLLNMWPWREIRDGEPSETFLSDRELRIAAAKHFDMSDPSQDFHQFKLVQGFTVSRTKVILAVRHTSLMVSPLALER